MEHGPRRRLQAVRRSGGVRSWLAFAALALLLGFAFQGTRGLWEPDEGRYAEVAREMLVSGDFLTPRLDLAPHFTKPPLTYWCIAASLEAFGHREWAVRLFLSVSFALTGLWVALLGARMWNRKTGILAGTIYLTSLTPFLGASFVTPDTLLALWTAIGLYSFWRSVESRSRPGTWLWPIATGVAFGLGFLTKGPPALAFLPGMLLWQRFTGSADRSRFRYLPGVLLGAALGLSWFVVVATRQSGLARFFLEGEVVGRILGHHHRNSAWYGPLVIYGPALLGGALPWCLGWPKLLRLLRATAAREGGLQSILRTRPRLALLVGCCLPALVIFCAVRSRLPLYVLPLFIPMALLTARGLVAAELALVTRPAMGWFGRRQLARLAVWVGGLFAIRLGLAALPTSKDARSLYQALRPLGDVELIVDDKESHHGLAFYSERNVEYVSGLGASPESVRTIPIANELAEESQANEGPHLYLVRRPTVTRLDELLRNARATIRARQDVGAFEAIWTEPGGMTGGGAGEWRWAGPRAMPPG